ncbi:MAG TPA: hypothetical protein VMC79_02420 [Rectinemataceae bacterium]|nr:hypothetical protein [Rectinemataceae bacterium]
MRGNEVNLHKALTGFHDETGQWYVLDNAGVIMPAVSNQVSTSLFRISARIDEPVHLAALQTALDRCARRFPYFAVELRRGLFWYYLEPHERALRVESDSVHPSQDFNINRRGTCLFRVRARGRQIACEFSHALSDGTGGLRFLKNLLAEYFRVRGLMDVEGTPGSADPDLYALDEAPDPREYEDAYHKHFVEEYPKPSRIPRAFHIASQQLPRFHYRIICGVVPLAEILAMARRYGVSLTEFLAAVFLDSLQDVWLETPPRQRRGRSRLAVEVPVNMRKFYPTETNRNFSLFVLATQDMRLGRREFPEIVSRAHHQLRFETDGRTIAQQISRNVSGSRKLAVRLVPLFIKDFFAKLLFSALGEDLVSGFVSNLGEVRLPEEMGRHVERFDFLPAPSTYNKTSAAVVSWRGFLYINFGSLARSRQLERLFFRRLCSLGLSVKIESNM